MRKTFDRWLLGGLGLVIALLVVSAAIVYRNTRQLHEDAAWVAHTQEVLGTLNNLLLLIDDAETGERGYLITHDKGYLKPYQDSLARIDYTVRNLERVTEDNEVQRARIPRLRTLIQQKLDELARTIALRNGPGFEAAQKEVLTHLGKNRMDGIRDAIAEMRNEEQSLLEDRQAANDRTYRIALASGSVASLTGLAAILAFAWILQRHLTARAEAATELFEQQERFRTTLASIGDAVIVTDPESRVTFLNAVAESLTGWSHQEAIGKPLPAVFNIINELTRQPAENPAIRAIKEGVIVGLANHTILRARDGSERNVDDSAAPIHDRDGQIAGCVLVFRDVTQRRGIEKTLRDADRRKDEFLATLAHELRNPLAPIRNAVELLRHAGDNPAAMEEVRRIMDRQVGQMVRLIDDLLEISRVTSGKLTLHKQRVKLAAVVQSAVEETRSLIHESGHELTITQPPEPIFLDADPTRLAQIFSNLLNNAAKYTEKGGRIWLTVERTADVATVSVRDTGIGLSAEHLSHIFEMFSQVSPALERSQGGLGIGLALVRGLVGLHGGTIEAHSSGPGLGSEFVVRLPISRLPAPPPATGPRPVGSGPVEERPGSTARRRILVVDDNLDAASSLAMLLRKIGHEVQTAHDGLEAVQAAAAFHPQIVLLDIGLPKMNGYEAAKRIREQSSNEQVTIVALTGWGQERDKEQALEAGFDYHLTKPAELAALQHLLETIGS
jgi:PAS domain S-box-containing protein